MSYYEKNILKLNFSFVEVCVGCDFERRGLKMSVRSDMAKFWLRMEKKIMEKNLRKKEEEEKNRDNSCYCNMIVH